MSDYIDHELRDELRAMREQLKYLTDVITRAPALQMRGGREPRPLLPKGNAESAARARVARAAKISNWPLCEWIETHGDRESALPKKERRKVRAA